MMEIHSLTNRFPEIEFRFRNSEMDLKVQLIISEGDIRSSREMVVEPYTRNNIIQLHLKAECEALIEQHKAAILNRNKT